MEKLKIIFFILAIIAVGVKAVSIEKDLSLTLSQKRALDKFREQVTPLLSNDFMKTDIYLIRWLRATNFNINAAETMLKKNIRWRQENSIDSIQTEDFSDMFRDFPITVDTYDKEGRPISRHHCTRISFYSRSYRCFRLGYPRGCGWGRGARLLRYMDMIMDNITQQVFERQQKGMNVTQWTILANAENFNMINHGCPICLPIWVRFLSSLENNYQGWMNEFIVFESPFAVNTIIDLLKPFLSHQTRDAIKVIGLNKNIWMPYLDARVARVGGTKPPVERN